MITKQIKNQTVSAHPLCRTAVFKDDCYVVHFQIPNNHYQSEVMITGFDVNLKQMASGFMPTEDFTKMIKEMKSHFISKKIKEINFWLPKDIGKVNLYEKDIAIVDLVLNEPDDVLMFELIENLESV